MHKVGFANQATSESMDDGLDLIHAYITATAHCAPPENKPLPEEMKNCRPFLVKELQLLTDVQVIIALGRIAFDTVLSVVSKDLNYALSTPLPKFSHGVEYPLPTGQYLLGSYHPSQQNTFTGKLTEPMFDAIFNRAQELIQLHEKSTH
jgi:uracil-DNA glycosylase family 4